MTATSVPDEQRMRLAVKAKLLGHRGLDELKTLVTPDTLLAWHLKLIALKWTYARKGRYRNQVPADSAWQARVGPYPYRCWFRTL